MRVLMLSQGTWARRISSPVVSHERLTNINNNMSFSYRVLSSGRSRGADLLLILSDTFAYPNPSHKPAGIYEFEECKQQTNIDKVVKSSDKQTGTQQKWETNFHFQQ